MNTPQKTEADEIIRLQAEQAMQFQKIIQDAQPFQSFLDGGHMEWLKKNVFHDMEREMIVMMKGLDFVPNSIAQVAHMKGQLEVLDRIENRILGRIQEAKDALHKLSELQHSIPQGDE